MKPSPESAPDTSDDQDEAPSQDVVTQTTLPAKQEHPRHQARNHANHHNKWERLWSGQGFIHGDNNLWTNPNTGERVQRDQQTAFHWIRYAPNGQVIERYWGSRETLTQGIKIPHETWQQFQRYPEQTCLIYWETDKAVIVKGRALLDDIEKGRIQIFPAVYRLRMTDGE